MEKIQRLFAIRLDGDIASEETALIDSELSTVSSDEIPDEQVLNVLAYLDAELLYNNQFISDETALYLKDLHCKLVERSVPLADLQRAPL